MGALLWVLSRKRRRNTLLSADLKESSACFHRVVGVCAQKIMTTMCESVPIGKCSAVLDPVFGEGKQESGRITKIAVLFTQSCVLVVGHS
mmetsp:Transcript_16787/g.26124  ORF Transcript_16787/g.26124 Transcript_16787/m.26124 type:complete len:90 (-) Transcript_16787:531-800(-)